MILNGNIGNRFFSVRAAGSARPYVLCMGPPETFLNARGKMLILKEVMEGKIPLNDELIDTLFQCTTCASCHVNCPSGVSVPDIIKQVRKDMVHIGSCHPAFKGMNEVLGGTPRLRRG